MRSETLVRSLQRILFLGSLLVSMHCAIAKPLSIVCVETSWCNIAKQIGRDDVITSSVIISSAIDPHEITPTPSMAREISKASLVILNGGAYDDWAKPFVSSKDSIIASETVSWRPGENQHLFLDMNAVHQVAQSIGNKLIDKGLDKDIIRKNLSDFLHEEDQIYIIIDRIRKKYHGQKVAMLEPIGATLLQNMGLEIIGSNFSASVLYHREPSPKDVAEMERSLKYIKFLVVNPSVQSPEINNMISSAKKKSIPMVLIGESLPQGVSWQNWITSIVTFIEKVLNEHV